MDLVTGGAGFIGSHLVDALDKVRVVDNLSLYGKLPSYWNNKAELFVGDIRDKSLMEAALDAEYVYHFAAHQGYSKDFSKFIDVNVSSVALLYEIIVEKHLPVKKVILASSQAAYGECLDATEMHTLNPLGIYGLSKIALEQIACFFEWRYGIDTVILRFGIVQGARQSHGILVDFCNQDIRRVFGDGNQVRDYIHIQDAIKACLLAKDLPNGVYNVSGWKAYSVWDYITMLEEAGSYRPYVKEKLRQYEAYNATSNCKKLESYGWRASVPISQAITDYLNSR